jgi:uncharacterized protein YbjT (DUF2867 family)
MNLCEAARRHGAAYAVKLSTVTPVLEMKVGGPYGAHLESEAALAASGMPFTVLRPNLFMHMPAAVFTRSTSRGLRAAHPTAQGSSPWAGPTTHSPATRRTPHTRSSTVPAFGVPYEP